MLEYLPVSSLPFEGNISIYKSKLSPAADYGVGFTIMFIVLLSVLGNGLVLWISYRRRKKITSSELLCVNLALVDFLCCICLYPLSIVSSFSHAWLGDKATCTYYGLGGFLFGLCGMFTIAAISVIRYLKTCHNISYVVWCEGAITRALCIATWLIAAAWSCFPLFGWGEYAPEPYGVSCTVAWKSYHTSVEDALFVVCSFACFTLIPILLIMTSQCQILYKVYRFNFSLAARGIRSSLHNAEKRISVMFFCISLGFVTAWAPYAVVSFLFIFHKDTWHLAPGGFIFPALFAKSSHVYNPFIYFYFNKTFRQELQCLVRSYFTGSARNRVSVSVNQPQAPAVIEVQPRGQSNLDRSTSHSQSNTNRVNAKAIYPCWVSKMIVAPASLEPRPNKEFVLISS
ncbi:opsin 8, group member c [Lepisosteus oculatus]|uniref:opsin 8, group member c n=1 Tax=Lepisosteus oculatus TaxID=7918 RepID=UPI0035F52AEC